MKIGKYDITLANIGSFVQGKTRFLVDRYGGEFFSLEEHIKEQVLYRESLANKECVNNKVCKCGCEIPGLFYADKTCEDGCYPVVMDKETWDKFKNDNNVETRV